MDLLQVLAALSSLVQGFSAHLHRQVPLIDSGVAFFFSESLLVLLLQGHFFNWFLGCDFCLVLELHLFLEVDVAVLSVGAQVEAFGSLDQLRGVIVYHFDLLHLRCFHLVIVEQVVVALLSDMKLTPLRPFLSESSLHALQNVFLGLTVG